MSSTKKEITLVAIECGGTSFLLSIGTLEIIEPENENQEEDKNKDDELKTPRRNNKSSSSNKTIQLTATKSISIKHKIRIPTTTPSETLEKCTEWLKFHNHNQYEAVGIASFGPLGLSNSSSDNTYGCILSTTPKEQWRNVNILNPLLQACQRSNNKLPPHQIDTDVNAPAWAEFQYAKTDPAQNSLAYVTIGTGVGVGLVINSKPVHGRMHPEAGHLVIQPLPQHDSSDVFQGYSWGDKCPYHGKYTVEAMTSSVALLERLNLSNKSQSNDRDELIHLSDDHPLWDHAANAIANLCLSLILVTSIHTIVLGGGVMNRNCLIHKVRAKVLELMNGYMDLPRDEDLNLFIRQPTWEHAGLVGAFVLAETAFFKNKSTAIIVKNTHNSFSKGLLIGACTVLLPLLLSRFKYKK